jgi:hypothetical protein
MPGRPAMKSPLCPTTFALCLLAATAVAQQNPPAPAQPSREETEQKAKWMKEQSNWGRWGANDELGALNLITPAKRAQAMALAKTGAVVSLSRPIHLVDRSASIKSDDRPATMPFFEIRFRSYYPPDPPAGYSFDMQSFAYHGGTYTHLDGLCHISYEGKLYNGFLQSETVDPKTGCKKMGIQALKDGIVTRGILIDFPRLRGVASLPPTERLRPADVEAWEKMARVKISSGDAVFLYTGWKEGARGGFGEGAEVGAIDQVLDHLRANLLRPVARGRFSSFQVGCRCGIGSPLH